MQDAILRIHQTILVTMADVLRSGRHLTHESAIILVVHTQKELTRSSGESMFNVVGKAVTPTYVYTFFWTIAVIGGR